ncbi:Transglycosylase SLT domain-containing protein [Geosporobacter subterraneus DSM 17957]|uniref:Transglycosylase SLT domain-containing protein n=1 Tax=Geosporobacter subterraneus DSM 17957 TaxID=1121919 RepID=A0A1M6DMB3_9FIRM|nr:transglycosylase SLT domain-containing protein [Geosporobacter subterraneus]SHI74271.1 Transglycosylase SLT domain-containing protein [Geosporobacter subterraneus DSM 17957]
MKQWKQYGAFILILIAVDLILALLIVNFWGDDLVAYLEGKSMPAPKVNIQQEKTAEEKLPIEQEEKKEEKKEEKAPPAAVEKTDLPQEKKSPVAVIDLWGIKNIFSRIKNSLFVSSKADSQKQDGEELQKEKIIEMTKLSEKAVDQILTYSKKTEVPISMILAVIEQESGFDKNALGKDADRGLMQIIPVTEKWLCDKYGEAFNITYDPNQIFHEEYNIALGTIYLWHLRRAYPEDLHRIFTEYNRGYYKSKDLYEEKKSYETKYSQSIIRRMEKYKVFDSQ